MFRIKLRRPFIVARFGIVAAVVGLVALASLSGAGATLASPVAPAKAAAPAKAVTTAATSSAVPTVGNTKCVPSGAGNLGLTCTGTYGVKEDGTAITAWNPWTGSDLPASDPPTVTISQARDLTDQDVHITWKNFTPTLSGVGQVEIPNPGSPQNVVFPVSIFECKGTTPDFSDLATVTSDCYTVPVGSADSNSGVNGPPNAQMGFTLDGDAPPASAITTRQTSGLFATPYSAAIGYKAVKSNPGIKKLPLGSPFCSNPSLQCTYSGGDPSTWSGQADFHVEAPTPRTKGGFFKCSASTPCSLVVDPVWGGVSPTGIQKGNNTYSTAGQCDTHLLGLVDTQPAGGQGDLLPGTANSPSEGQTTFPGNTPPNLIGNSGSCWARDRIVIPLNFASTPSLCPTTTPQFFAEGSPMMDLQMNQWKTGWCTGSGALSVQYTSNPESVARNDFLAPTQVGATPTDMTLVTLPADSNAQQGSSRKFTYAPLANSGTGVAFALDDGGTGAQMNRMVLNPELLAKLTSQSYSLLYDQCGSTSPGSPPPQPSLHCDPDVVNNPATLFDDNEFLFLNQDCQPVGAPYAQAKPYTCGTHSVPTSPSQPNYALDQSLGIISPYNDFPGDTSNALPAYGAFLPTVLQGNSDITYDLTSMLAGSSQAEAFLHGKSDPWGMHVNDNYLDVSYPISEFNILDQGFTDPSVKQCPPTPGQPCQGAQNTTMAASWIPQQDLNTIAQDLLTNQPTAQNNQPTCPASLNNDCTNATQLTPSALNVQPQGQRALLSVLDLGDIANYDFPAASIVNASGTAQPPSQASVEAAVKDMKTNPDGVTQFFDYSTTDKSAYPLSMVDYAMVPTCGLSKSEASDIAEFLTRAATTGQVQGEAPGQLGPGYYPLTSAQKAQTLKAASEVKAQDCKSLPPDNTIGGRTGVNDVTPPGSHGGNGTTGPAGSSGTSPAGSHTKGTAPGRSGPGAGVPTAKAQTAAFGQKSPDSGLTGLLLLLAMIVGGLAVIGGPAAWAVTVTGKWPVVARYTRPAWAWAQAAWARARAIRIWRP